MTPRQGFNTLSNMFDVHFIDDSPDIADVLSLQLDRLGLVNSVTTYTLPEDLLTALRQKNTDSAIVVTDYDLRNFNSDITDGYRLASVIKNEHPGLTTILISNQMHIEKQTDLYQMFDYVSEKLTFVRKFDQLLNELNNRVAAGNTS